MRRGPVERAAGIAQYNCDVEYVTKKKKYGHKKKTENKQTKRAYIYNNNKKQMCGIISRRIYARVCVILYTYEEKVARVYFCTHVDHCAQKMTVLRSISRRAVYIHGC